MAAKTGKQTSGDSWHFDNGKIVIGKKRFSLSQVSAMSFAIKAFSILIIGLALIGGGVTNWIFMIAGIMTGFLSFFWGIYYGRIAKEAKQILMKELKEKSDQKHKDKIKGLKCVKK